MTQQVRKLRIVYVNEMYPDYPSVVEQEIVKGDMPLDDLYWWFHYHKLLGDSKWGIESIEVEETTYE